MWGASVFHDRADQKQPQDPNVCHVSKSGGALTHPIAWNRSLGALWSTYYIRCPSLQSPIAPVTLTHGQCYKLLGFKPYLWWFSQGFTFSDSQRHIIIIRLRFTIQISDLEWENNTISKMATLSNHHFLHNWDSFFLFWGGIIFTLNSISQFLISKFRKFAEISILWE